MTPYRIEVRNSPNWQQRKAATLGVSITSPNWQDDKFASILGFAATRFLAINIDVTDALYRHGFMADGMTEDQALAHANGLGILWLTRHADIIDACPVKPTVVRWAEWYKHPDYKNAVNDFQNACEANSILNDAIHSDVMDFYRRHQKLPTEKEYEGSRNYFIEELAVITLQARALPSLRIYPGDELRCFQVVRSGLVPEAPKGLAREQYGKIKFVARNNHRQKVRPISREVSGEGIIAR